MVTLILLFFALLGSGMYFLFRKNNSQTEYILDKYQDIKDWCTVENKNEILEISCQGLLLDIRNIENGISCFDVQIITKDKELKDISICEKSGVLTYTNDILQYKKLMPTNMFFSYNKGKLLSPYSFASLNLTKLDDTYVQDIVNEDIADLVTLNLANTSIQNSVDFCPRPDTLPEFVIEDNVVAYSNFYNLNKIEVQEYQNSTNYSSDNTGIHILFGCDSQKIAGYETSCDIFFEDIPENILKISPNTPSANAPLTDTELYLLKRISLIYDAKDTDSTLLEESPITSIIKYTAINTSISPELYCSIYKLLSRDSALLRTDYLLQMHSAIKEDINLAPFCENIFDTIADKSGLYIKERYQKYDDNFTVQKRCLHLNKIIQNIKND